MELGIITFADMEPEVLPGKGINASRRLTELMEEIKLADELGLDVFGVGEHHRRDYAASSPATILAAAAVITKKIKLSSAVTVLSSDDPVRVFQQFATVDLLSRGRAEIMAGRGSFIESFPLFGYDLKDYNELFTDKLELLLEINKAEFTNWKGTHRAGINNLGVYPRPYDGSIPVWIAAGGTPESAIRAANLGLPLMLAIIGGMPAQFTQFIRLYKDSWIKAGHNMQELRLGINNHVYISGDSQQAADEFYPYYSAMMNKIGKERGWSPVSADQYEALRSPRAALMVGSPQQIIDKILYQYELFANTRFLAHAGIGTVPHDQIMKSIELFGTKVAPEIRKALSNK